MPEMQTTEKRVQSCIERDDDSVNELKEADMEATELVLRTMREAGQPLNAGKIAELAGLDRKVADKAMKELMASGAIVSPVRC